MKNLEFNKIAASILLAGLIAMVVANITDILYHPGLSPEKRGYRVEATESSTEVATAAGAPEAAQMLIGQLMAAANADNGAQVAKKCAACHDLEKSNTVKIGPPLWNIVGHPRAANAAFAYSPALKEKGGSWDYKDLFAFLHNPKQFAPGTKMTFIGLKKPSDLADVIAYLRKQADSAPPLPPVEP